PGYPVEDLALRGAFTEASRAAVTELATAIADAGHGDVCVVVGYLDADDVGPRNALAALYRGEVVATQYKHHLPNCGVFVGGGYVEPGPTLNVLRTHGVDLGLASCEDLWQEGGPVAALGAFGVDLVLALNASPYERAKSDVRVPLVTRRAAEVKAPEGAQRCHGTALLPQVLA